MKLTGHNPASRARAFTLIELILVLALLVVITSLTVPPMTKFIRGRALDSETRRFLAVTHGAQSRAVSEGMPMLVWVDSQGSRYGLTAETAGPAGDPKAETMPVDGTLQIAAQNRGAGDLPEIAGHPVFAGRHGGCRQRADRAAGGRRRFQAAAGHGRQSSGL